MILLIHCIKSGVTVVYENVDHKQVSVFWASGYCEEYVRQDGCVRSAALGDSRAVYIHDASACTPCNVFKTHARMAVFTSAGNESDRHLNRTNVVRFILPTAAFMSVCSSAVLWASARLNSLASTDATTATSACCSGWAVPVLHGTRDAQSHPFLAVSHCGSLV
jgi:hypothetical protein